MHVMLEWFRSLLGLGAPPGTLTYEHMAARAVLVYGAGIAMVRFSSKRFVGRRTPFDFVLSIILGATLSRAVNGSAAFFPTILAGFVLVLLDRVLAVVAYRSERIEGWLAGHPFELVSAGNLNRRNLRRCHCDGDDLASAARLKANVPGLDDVESAWLEPSGEISVVPRARRASP